LPSEAHAANLSPMQAHHTGFGNPAHLEQPIWLVWVEGGETVGPVSARQLARGIRSGRVPADASVQRTGDVFWSGILDEADIIAALKTL
jgi:hypothetical protein